MPLKHSRNSKKASVAGAVPVTGKVKEDDIRKAGDVMVPSSVQSWWLVSTGRDQSKPRCTVSAKFTLHFENLVC